MWVSKKRFKSLEKKVADLEEEVQSQQKVIGLHIDNHENEVSSLRDIFNETKDLLSNAIVNS